MLDIQHHGARLQLHVTALTDLALEMNEQAVRFGCGIVTQG